MLKTEIKERYQHHDEIYLISHSMGGLVARKYLYDMIKTDAPLQVKNIDIEKYLDVVDESSAVGYWGNSHVKSLPNTHTDIVKAKDCDDLSYIVFKNFIPKDNLELVSLVPFMLFL